MNRHDGWLGWRVAVPPRPPAPPRPAWLRRARTVIVSMLAVAAVAVGCGSSSAAARGPEITLERAVVITNPPGYAPVLTGCIPGAPVRAAVAQTGTGADGAVALAADPTCGQPPATP